MTLIDKAFWRLEAGLMAIAFIICPGGCMSGSPACGSDDDRIVRECWNFGDESGTFRVDAGSFAIRFSEALHYECSRTSPDTWEIDRECYDPDNPLAEWIEPRWSAAFSGTVESDSTGCGLRGGYLAVWTKLPAELAPCPGCVIPIDGNAVAADISIVFDGTESGIYECVSGNLVVVSATDAGYSFRLENLVFNLKDGWAGNGLTFPDGCIPPDSFLINGVVGRCDVVDTPYSEC